MSQALLEIKNLVKHFKTPEGTVRAVDGIDFSVQKGEWFSVVGESGSGKSTVAYLVAGIYMPTSGEILFNGNELPGDVRKRPKSLKREIQMVFQDPGGSINPKKNVREVITLPLQVHRITGRGDYTERVRDLLEMVGLPAECMERYPMTLGGGERQLVAVARALATNPSFILLDEPTSALDVSMQATVIRHLMELQGKLGLTYLFITHNLSVVRNVSSRVAIMYLGKVQEIAPTSEFFKNPVHPYTQMLLASIPVITDEEEALKPRKVTSTGEIPSPTNPPPGCSFGPRCPFKEDRCSRDMPELMEVAPGHLVRCHQQH